MIAETSSFLVAKVRNHGGKGKAGKEEGIGKRRGRLSKSARWNKETVETTKGEVGA